MLPEGFSLERTNNPKSITVRLVDDNTGETLAVRTTPKVSKFEFASACAYLRTQAHIINGRRIGRALKAKRLAEVGG